MTKYTNPIKGGAPNGAVHLAAPIWGRLAQLVEQLTLNQRVVGSNPSASTIFSFLAFSGMIGCYRVTHAKPPWD